MIIYYFHGWGGHFDETKHKILAQFGDEVYYPNIDYQNQRNIISHYTNEVYSAINSGKSVLVVGTSMGAYIGFHISNIVRCPALLINPAFFFKNGAEMRPNTNSVGPDDFQKHFVFSMKDEIVDVKRCIKFLKEFKYDGCYIANYDNLTHQIPIDIFEQEFVSFKEKYKTFKYDIPEDGSKLSSKKIRSKNKYTEINADGMPWAEPQVRIPVPEPVEVRPMGEPADLQWWDGPGAVNGGGGYTYTGSLYTTASTGTYYAPPTAPGQAWADGNTAG